MNNLNITKRALLAKKLCERVFHDEYHVLPAMEYTVKNTVFTYYIDIYRLDSIKEWDSHEEIPYLKTCCGQTVTKTPLSDKYNEGSIRYTGKDEILRDMAKKGNFINLEAAKVKRRLIGLREEPTIIRHPFVDSHYYDKVFSSSEYITREQAWEEESKGVLNNASRTYIDMVVSSHGTNRRILLKIVDGYKCDIFWETQFISERKPSHRTFTSSFDSHSYKKLFELYDPDNPFEFICSVHKDGVFEEDFSYLKYEYLYKYRWYHKNIVKCVNSEVDNMAINDMDCDSFKHYLNLDNVNILDIESGEIVNEKLSAELEEKVQFALIIGWLLSSPIDLPPSVFAAR